jgi:hypothetical protein
MLISGDNKVKFYNDFIKKCRNYLLKMQESISKQGDSDEKKLLDWL